MANNELTFGEQEFIVSKTDLNGSVRNSVSIQ